MVVLEAANYDQSMVVLEAAKAVSKSLPSMETIICRFSSLNPSSRSSRSSRPSRLWGKVTSVCVKVNQRNYPLMDLRVVKQTGRNQKSQINRYWSTSISSLRIPALFPGWIGKENLQHCIAQDCKKYLKASKTHLSFLELKHPSELFTCNKLSPFSSGVSRPGLHIVINSGKSGPKWS